MPTIDQYSVAAIPIEMFFEDAYLSVGTAFTWEQSGQFFLITNWHNLSGKDPFTGRHLSPTGAEPNRLRVWFNQKGQLGNKVSVFIPIRASSGAPLWFIHPSHGNQIDVVALPIECFPDVEMYPMSAMPNYDELTVQIGMDVFVLGYPFGVSAFPIWKRGSIASEPELTPLAQLHVFVDTASRPGMSGSPVIRRSWGAHTLAGGATGFGPGPGTKFVGVYSGRLAGHDPMDAQLGITWPAAFVPEIVSGTKIDA